VIFGHDHRTAKKQLWHDQIDDTLCVNVGQYTPKNVHYAVIEMAFKEGSPLPEQLRVTAFPHEQTLERQSGTSAWKLIKNR
jgi:hypothetical protein